MSPTPTARVLSTLREHEVQSLLMGGQACILYGAAEFSRDTDLTVFASPDNLERLGGALIELVAEVVAVPPFEVEYLARGHAVHFRCRHPEAERARLDVMSRLRGVDPFPELWERRTSYTLLDGLEVEVLALPDLVASKKTQRDKDWPMIRRLVEANYDRFYDAPNGARIRFWLRELRTPELLVECSARFAEEARAAVGERAAVEAAMEGDESEVALRLAAEEARERELDRAYWAPLKAELEQIRRRRRRELQ
ncbi:hypothetical protein BH18GEM1_BH18GEM1_03890 [soil metagenome]